MPELAAELKPKLAVVVVQVLVVGPAVAEFGPGLELGLEPPVDVPAGPPGLGPLPERVRALAAWPVAGTR